MLGEQAAVKPALAGRIGAVGSAAEHGEGRTARVEGARMGGGVDAERHPADDGDARRGQVPTKRVRDLEPVVGRPAGSDDADRRALDQRAEPAHIPGDVDAQPVHRRCR